MDRGDCMKLILSISGGGIRGLIPAIILKEIENCTGKSISDMFDLISGNSTGGIIACLLSVPDENNKPRYSAERVVKMYEEFGKKVFSRTFFRKILSFDGLISTKYSEKPLEKLLKQYFGDIRLEKACTNLLIPTYKISHIPYPFFFKTHHAKNNKKDKENPYLWECARATSAASSYFKPYYFDRTNTFIDGGIFANNPSLCAYAQAKKQWKNEKIILLSLGTGKNTKGFSYDKIKNWGLIQWAIPYFQQTSLSADDTVDNILKTMTSANGDAYYFIQTELEEKALTIDDSSDENLKRLEAAAERLIVRKRQTIDEICSLILMNT